MKPISEKGPLVATQVGNIIVLISWCLQCLEEMDTGARVHRESAIGVTLLEPRRAWAGPGGALHVEIVMFFEGESSGHLGCQGPNILQLNLGDRLADVLREVLDDGQQRSNSQGAILANL